MAVDLSKLGTTSDPTRLRRSTPTAPQAYAAATNDDNPAYASGEYAPPVFGVVPVFETHGPRRAPASSRPSY